MGWNPWLRQWDRDLEIFAQKTGQTEAYARCKEIGEVSFVDAAKMQWFLASKHKTGEVLSTVEVAGVEVVEEEERRCDYVDDSGQRCAFVGSSRAINMHKFRVHEKGGASINKYIVNNECPWCPFVSKQGRHGVKLHVGRVLRQNGEVICPDGSAARRRKYADEITVDKVEKWKCEECDTWIFGYEQIMQHVGAHIQVKTGKRVRHQPDEKLMQYLSGTGGELHVVESVMVPGRVDTGGESEPSNVKVRHENEQGVQPSLYGGLETTPGEIEKRGHATRHVRHIDNDSNC